MMKIHKCQYLFIVPWLAGYVVAHGSRSVSVCKPTANQKRVAKLALSRGWVFLPIPIPVVPGAKNAQILGFGGILD